MTPEVRGHIFSYIYNASLHGSKDYCIPYQLQKLFANLQISRSPFAVTTSLTKSFHWTSHQSFEQQDVQEFCRVLFDAIDKSFRLTIHKEEELK
jgi:ubiquitin carboxyl-terminal hydrolase 47